MGQITIPRQLADAVETDDVPSRRPWLAALPDTVAEIAAQWRLELSAPYRPGGQCAWVAPARTAAGDKVALKVGWRHREAEHEADGLRHWDGDGAVRCLAATSTADTTALLLERCIPGRPLAHSLPEPEQDMIVAGLLGRLWARTPPEGHPFESLAGLCRQWADGFERDYAADDHGLDAGLAAEGMAMLRDLPGTASTEVLLCTDLHAGNILAARREPWLVIDPKPFVGDPAFDPVQHMLNCDERLAADPVRLARRLATLLELDPDRVQRWLFARCVQESLRDLTMRDAARRLAR